MTMPDAYVFEQSGAATDIRPVAGSEKLNYCDRNGNCQTEKPSEEKSCHYFKEAHVLRKEGYCIMRSWFAGCMSPDARKAAREAAFSPAQPTDAVIRSMP